MTLKLLCIILDFFGSGQPVSFYCCLRLFFGWKWTKTHHPPQLCPGSCPQHDIWGDTIKIIPCEATSDCLLDCVIPDFLCNDGMMEMKLTLNKISSKDADFRYKVISEHVLHTLFSFADALHELKFVLPLKNE